MEAAPTSPRPVLSTTAAPTPTLASPTASSAPSGLLPPPVRRCTSAQLRLTVRDADSGAGQLHQRVILTSRRATCTLHGYPGASFLDSRDRLIGSPADESPGIVRRLLLRPGHPVVAILSASNAGAYPDSRCRPQQAVRLRIYPPGDRVALVTADPLLVCAATGSGQLHIGPLQSDG